MTELFPKISAEHTKLVNGQLLRRGYEYTDIDGRRRNAVYFNTGPAGHRWVMEDGSIITIDYVMTEDGPWNPWENARDIVEAWVLEKP